jgi:hypothetical protein
MIPGFNHNIKHKGRVFHVQTEDSGAKNPHIITHLFEGGNILASTKTQYADILQQPSYEVRVRKMMEDQHKQMLRNLIAGDYDNGHRSTAFHLDGPAPLNFTATSPVTNAIAGDAAYTGLPSQQLAAAPEPAAPALEERRSIFGDDLISEKSLDEVILSYLAEDLMELE